MLFKKLEINNFRNFEHIEVDLSNRNIFFGMNDIGKTNLLFALRFVLDNSIRRDGFQESDFYNYITQDKEISIILTINLNDEEENEAVKKDIEKISGVVDKVLSSESMSEIVIKVSSNFDTENQRYNAKIEWGSAKENLEAMQLDGLNPVIDRVFNVIYISPTLNFDNLFKKQITSLIKKKNDNMSDLKNAMAKANDEIAKLSGVKDVSLTLGTEYSKYNDGEFEFELLSNELYVDPYKTITPYIRKAGCEKPLPLAGDGQKRLAIYAIYKLLAYEKRNTKITIFFIEEPENSLHKTSLLKLSNILFNEEEYRYLFLTTHSAELLIDMDNINLVRIFCKDALHSVNHIYKVPEAYLDVKKMLNSSLAQALFCNKVILVEGPSEEVLFDKVLSDTKYTTKGLDILSVNGLAFEEYINVLLPLRIETLIKTDNDIRKSKLGAISLLGLNRIQSRSEQIAELREKFAITQADKDEATRQKTYINSYNIKIPDAVNFNLDNEANILAYKKEAFSLNKDFVAYIKAKMKIFLSEIDLEYDLYPIIKSTMDTKFNDGDPIKLLKESKLYNMVLLAPTLNNEDIKNIKDSDNFDCLKEFVNGIIQRAE